MSTFSKLVICAVMLRGRHRGLPVALDRAIVFPSEFVQKVNERENENKRKQRIVPTTPGPVAAALAVSTATNTVIG